jgi:RNA polymerase sigma-70 factor (ECF subfamily)
VAKQDDLYQEVAAMYGSALERLARAYEADADRVRDLLQDIHVALWQSLRRAGAPTLVGLDELDETPAAGDTDRDLDQHRALERLQALVHRLKPLDRQLMLLYLEGVDAAAIGEVTGLSAGNVATKIHRIKAVLARRFHDPEAR